MAHDALVAPGSAAVPGTTGHDEAGGGLAVIGAFGPLDLLSYLAHEHYLNGRCEQAVRTAREALAVVVPAGDQRTERYLRYTLSLSLVELDRWAEAAEEVRQLLRGLNDSQVGWRAKALSVVANVCLGQQRPDGALDALAEAYSLVQGSEPVTYTEFSAVIGVGCSLARAQLFEPAEELLILALRSPAVAGDGRDSRLAAALTLRELALMDTVWALALALVGDAAGARERFVRAAQHALHMLRVVDDDDAELTGRALAIEAFAVGQLGEHALAASRLRAAAEAFELSPELPETLIARVGLADALVALGELADARVHADSVLAAAHGDDRLVLQLAGLAALSSIEIAEHGDHPVVAHLRESRRLALRKLLSDRHSQFLALRDRVRVRALADRASALGKQAVVDPLTGLGNRRMLDAGLATSVAGAALWIDVDQFKAVNDAHSYAAGDSVLCRVADVLRAHCRADDVIVRYGGDEFVVLLPEADVEVAAEVGERVRAAVAGEAWDVVSAGLRVTVSVGVAVAAGLDLALRLADEAVHGAKRCGRDRMVVLGG